MNIHVIYIKNKWINYFIIYFFKYICCILLFILIFRFTHSAFADENDFDRERKSMVEDQIKSRGILDKKVLWAMKKIKRHLFVGKEWWSKAYSDHPIPIGDGQTISQPYVVALMTEVLELKETDKVLEIGTGSGYQAAVIAEIAKEVYSIEIRERLAQEATQRLRNLGYRNIFIRLGDGYFGWEEKGPFDAIVITCAANHIPPPLIKQLKEGGRLVLPLGSARYYQTMTRLIKQKGSYVIEYVGGCKDCFRFVPMTGEAETAPNQKP